MAARSPLSTSPGLGGGSGGVLTGRAAPFPLPLPTAAEAAYEDDVEHWLLNVFDPVAAAATATDDLLVPELLVPSPKDACDLERVRSFHSPTSRELHFDAPICAAVLSVVNRPLQQQLAALEAANMGGRFARNGASFDAYFGRWNRWVHVVTNADGTLMGFGICSDDGSVIDRRRAIFVYELHVAQPFRRRGVASAMLDEMGGGAAMELQVHELNGPAIACYQKNGFFDTKERVALEEGGGALIVMRRAARSASRGVHA